jgi:hypothetical protein
MEGKEESESNQAPFEESMRREVVSASVVCAGVRRDSLAHAMAMYILALMAEQRARNTTRLYATHLNLFTGFTKQLRVVAAEDVMAEAVRGYLAWLEESGRFNEGGLH